jgi:hypothetical protein
MLPEGTVAYASKTTIECLKGIFARMDVMSRTYSTSSRGFLLRTTDIQNGLLFHHQAFEVTLLVD